MLSFTTRYIHISVKFGLHFDFDSLQTGICSFDFVVIISDTICDTYLSMDRNQLWNPISF